MAVFISRHFHKHTYLFFITSHLHAVPYTYKGPSVGRQGCLFMSSGRPTSTLGGLHLDRGWLCSCGEVLRNAYTEHQPSCRCPVSLSLSLVFSTSPVFNLTYNAAATSHHSLSLGKKLRPEGKEAWREIATLNIPSTCVTASSPQYHLRPSQNTDSRHPPRMIQT